LNATFRLLKISKFVKVPGHPVEFDFRRGTCQRIAFSAGLVQQFSYYYFLIYIKFQECCNRQKARQHFEFPFHNEIPDAVPNFCPFTFQKGVRQHAGFRLTQENPIFKNARIRAFCARIRAPILARLSTLGYHFWACFVLICNGPSGFRVGPDPFLGAKYA
jgi:hypothetical protein